MLNEVELIHQAAPELDLDLINLKTRFLGRELNAPLMVTAVTGGHPLVEHVNCAIAEAVESLGIAMGVGSQRAAIENPSPEVVRSFRIVRECAPHVPLIANVGGAQLVRGYSARELRRAIEMVDADAIAVHLNVGQELVQPEGDRRFHGIVDAIAKLIDELDVPIVDEV
jgi:isopentenyl-diphosphate delta-isomerase